MSVIAVVGLMLSIGGAGAHEFEVGQLTIDHPWARATAASQRNGAAYLTVRNKGGEPDRLLSAAAEVSERVELHTHEIDAQGVARMRQVPAIELPPGKDTALQPGGFHVMLLGLEGPLADGHSFPLRLRFEKAGEVTVEVSVQKGIVPQGHGAPAAAAGGHGGHGMHAPAKTN